MLSARVSKVQLAERMGVDEKEVRRLLDPHHASKLPRIAEAVQALGQHLVISLEVAQVVGAATGKAYREVLKEAAPKRKRAVRA